jgi:Spherulation-specific family 4
MHTLLSISSIARRLRLTLSITGAALALATQASATGLIMPIYGNTATQFSAAIAAAGKVSMIAVINPDDGPGSRKVSGISGNVSKLRSAGAIAAGYVNSFYGGESLSSVYAQIDHHVAWYGVNGVFIDEMSNSTSKVSYYTSIYKYAKAKGLRVIGNPGTNVSSKFSPVADTLVTYEDPQSKGWSTHSPSSWTTGQAASKIAAIVYASSAGSMKAVVDKAIARRYGWVFVTDGSGGDPFGKAPSYLASEADYVRSKNGGKK